MIFYIYDEKTKEYIGTQNGFIDPLETKKQGKNVYLVPPNATDKKPLKTKENQAVIFNGSEWEIIADYRSKTYYIGTEQHEMKELGDLPKGATFEPVEPEKSLSELKSEKLSELSIQAQAFENNVNKEMWFKSSVNGYLINGDRRTRSNIQDLIAYQPTNTVIYRDYENIERELTKDQLKVILKEHAVNGQMLYEQKWAFEDKINACTAIEELNAIEIKFTMHDFSKEVANE